jgi:hypothetical protein
MHGDIETAGGGWEEGQRSSLSAHIHEVTHTLLGALLATVLPLTWALLLVLFFSFVLLSISLVWICVPLPDCRTAHPQDGQKTKSTEQ